MGNKINVLMVCLGNICRSPMAEAVFQDLINQAGLSDQFQIDSAGTARYHVGEPAHIGTRQTLAQHGITYMGKARQVTASELSAVDYIMAMDSENLSDLKALTRDRTIKERIHLLLEFAPSRSNKDVPDPYYTGNFENVYQIVKDGCAGLLKHILAL